MKRHTTMKTLNVYRDNWEATSGYTYVSHSLFSYFQEKELKKFRENLKEELKFAKKEVWKLN